MELRKPKNCPRCGSTKLAQILYGRPTAEAMEAVERGEVVLGGCFVLPHQPDWNVRLVGTDGSMLRTPPELSGRNCWMTFGTEPLALSRQADACHFIYWCPTMRCGTYGSSR